MKRRFPALSLILFLLLGGLSLPSKAQIVLQSTRYADGQTEAIWFDLGGDRIQVVRFHPNGLLKEIGHWEGGKLHGSWALWAENGRKVGEAEYRYGRKSGTWRIWDEQGQETVELQYRRDELVAHRFP